MNAVNAGMADPHPAVISAFANRARKLSADVEKLARYGRHLNGISIRELWLAQKLLFNFAKKLQTEAK